MIIDCKAAWLFKVLEIRVSRCPPVGSAKIRLHFCICSFYSLAKTRRFFDLSWYLLRNPQRPWFPTTGWNRVNTQAFSPCVPSSNHIRMMWRLERGKFFFFFRLTVSTLKNSWGFPYYPQWSIQPKRLRAFAGIIRAPFELCSGRNGFPYTIYWGRPIWGQHSSYVQCLQLSSYTLLAIAVTIHLCGDDNWWIDWSVYCPTPSIIREQKIWREPPKSPRLNSVPRTQHMPRMYSIIPLKCRARAPRQIPPP